MEKMCLGDGRLFVGGRGAGRSQRRMRPQRCKERSGVCALSGTQVTGPGTGLLEPPVEPKVGLRCISVAWQAEGSGWVSTAARFS